MKKNHLHHVVQRYYCGDDEGCLNSIAWFDDNAFGMTHPVGQKQLNAWGFYDMSGNVWEWCRDWYAETYYASSPELAPPGPDSGSSRVIRGGSWGSFVWGARSSFRDYAVPSVGSSSSGFRLCLP